MHSNPSAMTHASDSPARRPSQLRLRWGARAPSKFQPRYVLLRPLTKGPLHDANIFTVRIVSPPAASPVALARRGGVDHGGRLPAARPGPRRRQDLDSGG